MFSILDRYIGKIIFNDVTLTLFILISLSGIIKFIEQLRKVGQGGYSSLDAGCFIIFSVPKDIEIFFPMAVLLGTLLGLGSLSSHNELVVMQSSGFSNMQIAGSIIKTITALVALIMIISEWISPVSEQIAYNYRNKIIYNGSILSTKKGLWTKDGNNFIFIEQIIDSHELIGVSIYHFDENEEKLQSLLCAVTAKFSKETGTWKLSQVNESNLTNDSKIMSWSAIDGEWKSTLTPDKLLFIILDPNSLSISKLHNYIQYLKQSGQKFNRYQLSMWNKIFLPLSIMGMIFMTLSFIFGPLRFVAIKSRLIIGASVGFTFYIFNKIFGPLSLVYKISPIIGAVFPGLSFLIVSIIILLKFKSMTYY